VRTPPLAVLLIGAILLSGCTANTAPSPETPAPSPSESAAADAAENFTPLVGSVIAAPRAAPSTDGSVHLAYELLLANVLSQDVTLDSVTVMADGGEALELAGDDLAAWMKIYGGDAGSRVLGPGQQALVWLDVVVETVDDVPARLIHEIGISPATAVAGVITTPMTETLAPTTPDRTEPITIGPPLTGAKWFDGNSCCAVTPHRAAVNPINGALHVPERFAIDFVQLDDEDRVLDGPVDELSSYAYYGADVIAVGDGPIVSMRSDLDEQTPGANPTGLSVDEYGGNHVVQKLDDGHYAFYAHLQPGNPEGLEVGQTLRRGDVVGQLGNTGNTDAPHLHFHIMDSPLPLASNGMPFLIDSFEFAGRVPEQSLTGCVTQPIRCELDTTGSGARTEQSPLYLDVIDLP
jgi:hypothetical protein